jgi:hypothetical protein
MTRLEKIEREIASLSEEEFRKLARWIADRDSEIWEARMEADSDSGRLDALAKQAVESHRSGKTRAI